MMNHKTMTILSTIALSGCWWVTPAHDDGDEAFVAQAIEAVLGRKPKGSAEVRVLADISASAGRQAMLEVLFQQPEYVEYWSAVLADDIEVQRAGPMQIDANCTADALLPPTLSVALAGHLATAPPSEPFCVWSGAISESKFQQDDFYEAFDQAESSYKFDRIDPQGGAQPIVKPMWDANKREPGVPSKEPTKELDLERFGSGPGNREMVFDDGKGEVAGIVDWKRWDELQDRVFSWECMSFNLTDVIEASVRADRLDALYRAYLPVLATFPGSGEDADMRAELGSVFLDVYLDRDPTCMGCHTATYSTTDARPLNQNWDRFDPLWYGLPVPFDAEGTVFSYDEGSSFVYGGDGGDAVRSQVGALFRRDNHTAGGLRPWGFDETCVTNPSRGFDGFSTVLSSDPLGETAAFAGVGPTDSAGVLDLVDALSGATSTFHLLAFTTPDWASYRASHSATLPASASCGGCHEPPGSMGPTGLDRAPLLRDKVPLMTDARLFSAVRNGSGAMSARASTDAAAWNMVEWVRDNYPNTPALQMQDRRHGLLFLLAANVVNKVADEVIGENFVMNHGFPRNPDQARALSSLALVFAEDFSLKSLLTEIILSDGFNRQPPEEPGTAPYTLHMLPYPEAEVSPVVSPIPIGANANSEGDFVHKHSPAGLVHQVHHALGWPAPSLGGDASAYPTAAEMSSFGRYTSRTAREREQFGIDTFLSWESTVASCEKPDLVYAKDVSLVSGSGAGPNDLVGPEEWVDFIDQLVTAASVRGDSWESLAVSVKDRLLANPSLAPEEKTGIEGLWGRALSDSPLDDGVFSAEEEDLLRDYCGVLLATPHFVLRGVRLADALPSKLPEPICLPGERCTEGELLEDYIEILQSLPPSKD